MRSLSRCWKVPLLALVVALTAGGTASASVQSLSIDESATLSPGRQAIVLTGDITCSVGETWAITGARVIQGRQSGFGSLFSQACTGESQDWSLAVITGSGLFHRGRASAGITAISCGFGCSTAQVDRFVTVR
jgi:hypothetical protein